MTRKEAKYRAAIERRINRLAERTSNPDTRGDLGRQRLELAALRWALTMIDGRAPSERSSCCGRR